ncbi:hypothetical protein PoMZ_02203 [Pyricularia oryzae]|uniref:Uncharacterized protein n=1 Tax=Pyricularia oryzae TaxID=318829 RepID=A0A4P7N481_PYROR|nr:hypothetical protein PoMZ_02203 [Pyricularia oryzae]
MSLSELSKSCASTEAKQTSINLVPQVPIDLPDYLRFIHPTEWFKVPTKALGTLTGGQLQPGAKSAISRYLLEILWHY